MSRNQVRLHPQTKLFNVITSTKESFTSNQRAQVAHQQEIEKSFMPNKKESALVPEFPTGFINVELGLGHNLKANSAKGGETKRNRRKKQQHNDPTSLVIQEVHESKVGQGQGNGLMGAIGSGQIEGGSKNGGRAGASKPVVFTDLYDDYAQQQAANENEANLVAAERYAQYKKRRQQANALKSQKMQKKAVNKGLLVLPLSQSAELKTVGSRRPESSVSAMGEKEVVQFESSNILFEQQATEVQAKQRLQQRVEIANSAPRGGMVSEYNFKREKVNWRNFVNPEYSLQSKEGQYLVGAKKEMGHLNSLYVISAKEKSYDRRGKPYMGYLNGNFTGSEFNLYQRSENQDQLVATICYINEISCAHTFRRMEVYIRQAGVGGVAGQSLREVYGQEGAGSRSVVKLVNRVPVWNQKMECFTLNFHGKSRCGSIKNTILVEEGSPKEELMLFCKTEEHQFHLEMKYPLTPFVALGIVLTGFDFKLCCE